MSQRSGDRDPAATHRSCLVKLRGNFFDSGGHRLVRLDIHDHHLNAAGGRRLLLKNGVDRRLAALGVSGCEEHVGIRHVGERAPADLSAYPLVGARHQHSA